MRRDYIIPALLFAVLFFATGALLLRYVLYLLFGIVLPVPLSPNPRISFLLLFTWVTMAGLAIYIGQKANPWVGCFVGLAVFSGHYPFSTQYSQASLQCVLLGGVWYLICVDWLSVRGRRWVKNVLCVFALVNVFFLILQYFDMDPLTRPREGETDALSGLMTYTHGCSAILAVCFSAFLRRYWIWGLIPLSAGLFMTATFVGPLALAAAVLWFLFKNLRLWPLRIVTVAAVAMGLFAYAHLVDMPDTIWRYRTWKVVVIESTKHPFSGSGLNHFQFLFANKEISNYTANSANRHKYAHNDWMQAGFEMGMIGTWLIMSGYLVDIARRYSYQADIEIMAFITVFVAASVGFPFHIGLSAIILITWLAMLERVLRDVKEVAGHTVFPDSLNSCFLGRLAVAGGFKQSLFQ